MYNLYSNHILEEIYAKAYDPQYADKTAIHEAYGQGISYSQLIKSTEKLAKNLVKMSFNRGDKVLMLVRPNIATLQIALAVVRAGGTLVIADPAMGKQLFQERLALVQAQWAFVESALLWLQKLPFLQKFLRQRGIEIPEMGDLDIPHIVSVGNLPFVGHHRLKNLMQSTDISINFQECERNPHDDITIVFTSGTTGKPKGVVHTLHSMLSTLERIRDYAQITDKDVIYDTGILFIIPALMAGGTVVMGQGKFSAEKTVRTYRDYSVTKTLEIPKHMKAIAQHLQQKGEKLPESLADLMLGAAPVFADFLEQLQSVTHPSTRIWSIYGMTELLPATFVSIDEKLAFNRDGGDLVGLPMDGLTAEIADDGELILSGNGLFDRYFGMEKVTKHRTGDMARIDEQGRIVLLGRKKDMIIRGKYNIYPPLFEPTIKQIEGVSDCAMVGVYNPEKADEEIILFVESESSLDESALRQQLLSGENSIDLYAQPDFIFFEKLPYSGRSLKLDKKALRQRARDLLNIRDDQATLFEAET